MKNPGRSPIGPAFLMAAALMLPLSAGELTAQARPTRSSGGVGVGAEGRIVPGQGVIRVAAPYSLGGPPLLQSVNVKVGDWVQAGQVLAVLATHSAAQAQVSLAEKELATAEANLALAKAGRARAITEMEARIAEADARFSAAEAQLQLARLTTPGQLEAARAELAAAQKEVSNASTLREILDAERTAEVTVVEKQLEAARSSRERDIVQAQLDAAKAAARRTALTQEVDFQRLTIRLKAAQVQLAQAEAALVSPSDAGAEGRAPALVEIEFKAARRALDILRHSVEFFMLERQAEYGLAQARVETAKAGVDRAHAELALSVVRAPSEGEVLVVHARPGELVGPQGILEMGDTRRMYVEAQVYISDIRRVQLGQYAVVSGDAIDGEVSGRVASISHYVVPNNLFNIDPSEFNDQRVVLVRIRLDDPREAATIVNSQVTARIVP